MLLFVRQNVVLHCIGVKIIKKNSCAEGFEEESPVPHICIIGFAEVDITML
jgi:hypothetical protein